eukprot:scaffold726_cov262-Pinguiococcus_pyrenoidosus.AAC.24
MMPLVNDFVQGLRVQEPVAVVEEELVCHRRNGERMRNFDRRRQLRREGKGQAVGSQDVVDEGRVDRDQGLARQQHWDDLSQGCCVPDQVGLRLNLEAPQRRSIPRFKAQKQQSVEPVRSNGHAGDDNGGDLELGELGADERPRFRSSVHDHRSENQVVRSGSRSQEDHQHHQEVADSLRSEGRFRQRQV